jgi:hypothetical protein
MRRNKVPKISPYPSPFTRKLQITFAGRSSGLSDFGGLPSSSEAIAKEGLSLFIAFSNEVAKELSKPLNGLTATGIAPDFLLSPCYGRQVTGFPFNPTSQHKGTGTCKLLNKKRDKTCPKKGKKPILINSFLFISELSLSEVSFLFI